MSPIANTSGCPGSVQSGLHRHPPRAVGLRAGRVRQHLRQRRGLHPGGPDLGAGRGCVSTPFGPFTVMHSSDIAVAAVFTRTSTPIFFSRRWVYFAASGRTAAAPRGALEQHDPRLAGVDPSGTPAAAPLCANSASWPASSTPVGPAPMTTNVSNSARSSGSAAISAISNFDRMPSAQPAGVLDVSSCPGANSANSSWPK